MTVLTNKLWQRWVGANALGELVGLGGTLGLMAWITIQLGEGQGTDMALFMFLLAVASGAIEAAIVGGLQWWAMHPWTPTIRLRDWWLATLIGALVAYVLGWLPSTLMSMSAAQAPATQAAASEPSPGVVLFLAAGLGLVSGAVLSFAQWLALRGKVQHAGWWLPANMLAWAVGMPLIFWGIDAAQKSQPAWQTLLIMALTLLATGALVGAIHGAFLVRMVDASPLEET
jgi:hypothetical protein